MLFTCLPPGGAYQGPLSGPAPAARQALHVDIHCHVHTPKADEMVKDVFTTERDATMRFANERTREVQRQQTERTHIQLTSVEKRLADLDVMTRLAPCTGSNPEVSCRTPAILRREGLPRP